MGTVGGDCLEICFIHALPEECYRRKKGGEMVGAILGPALRQSVRFLRSWLQQRREVRVYLLAWHKHCSSQRDLRSSLSGDVALAAPRGGADRAAHAPFGGGLRLRLRIWFWLWCIVVGGPAFSLSVPGLSVPVSTGIIAAGLLWLTFLRTPFQPGT
ncbi:hypothetical protein PFLUV_G00226410, partial [Perca fluviatilis]